MKKRVFPILIVLLVLIFLMFKSPIINSFVNGKTILGLFKPFYLEESLARIFINLNAPMSFIIFNPQNITYNFSIGSSLILNLSVTTNVQNVSWWYDLYDLKHNVKALENVAFSPNTTFNAVRWGNKITVFMMDDSSGIINSSVMFFININNSAPLIDNLKNEYLVCESNFTSIYFNVLDVDEDSISSSLNPAFPFSPFYIRFINNINWTYSSHRIYSGIHSKDDVGGINNQSKTYQEVVSVSDNNGGVDYKTINITVIEINNFPVLSNIGTHTIWVSGENSTFTHQVSLSDREDGNEFSGNFNFNLSFENITLFNISNSGFINFTANSSFVHGSNISETYNIELCVTDRGLNNPHQNISICGQSGRNLSTCQSFSLVITRENRAPRIIFYSPENLTNFILDESLIYLNITKYDPDSYAVDTLWYVDNKLVEFDQYNSYTNSSNDDFYYKFGCGNTGRHEIKAIVSDGELNSSVTWSFEIMNFNPCSVSSLQPSGGGGGVLAKKLACNESWGCEEWSVCYNNEISYLSRIISSIGYYLINERCKLFNWTKEVCGYQKRTCIDLNACMTNKSEPGIIQECYYTKNPDCFDGIKNCHDNSCEVGIDCGGPCFFCPSCSDKILNQDETDIDCGGTCPACEIIEKPIDIKKTKNYLFWYLFIVLLIVLLISVLLIRKYYLTKKEYNKLVNKKKDLQKNNRKI